jgi:hypothetical protein
MMVTPTLEVVVVLVQELLHPIVETVVMVALV